MIQRIFWNILVWYKIICNLLIVHFCVVLPSKSFKMEFPNLGAHCSEPTCQQLDYLPMKCDACEKVFCKEHIFYEHHNCSSAYQKNVQVPVCPLCNTPIPVKRGDPPDIAVGAHIDSDCQSHTARDRRKIYTNKCSLKGCHQKEVIRVICTECKFNFCLKHRHPADHKCVGQAGASRERAFAAALSRWNGTNSSSASKSVNNRNWNGAASVQGNMSEDEALAHAIAKSLEDADRQTRNQNYVPTSPSQVKCSVM